MPGGRLLASYRPTVRQVFGRTVFAAVVVGLVAVLGYALVLWSGSRSPWIYLIFLPALAIVGFVALSELGRHGGVDATDRGLTRVTHRAAADRFVPWRQVVDLRTERRGWRTVVVVQRADGTPWRLRAPYDGKWLSHDPDFEPKLFNLRNLWETYRTWDTVRPTGRPEDPGGVSGGAGR